MPGMSRVPNNKTSKTSTPILFRDPGLVDPNLDPRREVRLLSHKEPESEEIDILLLFMNMNELSQQCSYFSYDTPFVNRDVSHCVS